MSCQVQGLEGGRTKDPKTHITEAWNEVKMCLIAVLLKDVAFMECVLGRCVKVPSKFDTDNTSNEMSIDVVIDGRDTGSHS